MSPDTPPDPNDPLAGSLSHSEPLAVVWQATPALAEGLELADLNRRATALLGLLGGLDEPAPLPEDDPQLAAHLQRLDHKLDLLLGLVGQWLTRELTVPAPQPVRLGVRGVLWQAALPPGPGRVSLYLRPTLPVALQLPALLSALPHGQVLAEFQGLDPQLADALERYIFRQHRRAVAQARRPA